MEGEKMEVEVFVSAYSMKLHIPTPLVLSTHCLHLKPIKSTVQIKSEYRT